jgi:Lon protease-like protein
MPLHVFEERYRALVRHLLTLPEDSPREFGVVAIRRGWEVDVGTGEVTLHDVGCTAEVRKLTEHPDGRFDLVTVGRVPFEITQIVPADTPYLQAEVRYLKEPEPSPDIELVAPQVLALFQAYLRLIRADAAGEQLPEDPTVLSHLVAATTALTVAERQELLAIPDTAGRLRAELGLLRRELGLLREVRAVPATLADLSVKPGSN